VQLDKKDLLEDPIKTIMEDETKELFLSESIKQNILETTNHSISRRLKEFLNKELELPLLPISLGLAAAIILSIVPVESLLEIPETRTIDFGTSQVIIRDYKEVSQR
jgi:hypothetical protein